MYIAYLINGGIETEIHGEAEKLKTGNVVKGVNCIDSFSFSMLPNNRGFNSANSYKTLVRVYNTSRKRNEFYGRVLYSTANMDSVGLITKEAVCESYLGFLCDSIQTYVEEKNWTVDELLEHIVSVHNSQVEEYKQFRIGDVTVTDPNDNLYIGIQRENTWDTLQAKLVETLGGEFSFRVVDGINYLDYLEEAGEIKTTEIMLSRNMKAIRREKDPTSYITRLIPYGCKLYKEVTTIDQNGNRYTESVETEERLDITSVNDGKNYIDDVRAIEAYGIHVGKVEFDDVTEATNLLTKGREYLAKNNRVQVRYMITALDLSLIGLDLDDFEVRNSHPIKNALLGIDDTARIIRKTIDICEPTSSTIEVGDNFKLLSDIQLEQSKNVENIKNEVGKIEMNYATNEKLWNESRTINSLISQTTESIMLKVQEEYLKEADGEALVKSVMGAELTVLQNQIMGIVSGMADQIESLNGEMNAQFNEIKKYFSFSINGLTIGQIDSPFKVVIDNDRYSMLVNGVEVLWLDPDGKSNIPELTITKLLNLFGYIIDKDAYGNVNCGYAGER